DLRKGPVVMVMKEQIGFGGIVGGRAVGFPALLAAPEVVGGRPVHIATDIEIEPAVAIIVQPGTACTHPSACDACPDAALSKAASRFIMEEEIPAPAGDIDVREAIVVIVSHAAANRMGGDVQPGLPCHIHKTFPVLVMVENDGTLRRFRVCAA